MTALSPAPDLSPEEAARVAVFDAAEEPEEVTVELPATFPVGDFWAKVEIADDCWPWLGRRTPDGYGLVMHKRKNYRAHRVAWLLAGHQIPAGLVLDHLCRVRHCVNPDHMEPVTNRENVLRGVGYSAVNAAKTHCQNDHALTGENLIVQRKPDGSQFRTCRECRNAKARIHNARRVTCHCGTTTRAPNLRRHQRAMGCLATAALTALRGDRAPRAGQHTTAEEADRG